MAPISVTAQFDDFQLTLPWFIGRLEIKAAEEREWNMMAIVNVSAVLEYGKPTGVLKKAPVQGTFNAHKKYKDKMDVDEDNARQQESPAMSEVEPNVQVAPALPLLCATASGYGSPL
ncbi:hypothetical protein C8R45DRAFT_1096904 [Mycena sanguinolenta]|nr:hypothetical protein C8R45DRAFT_1096904 [Mycena sanguinolenta]